MTKQLSVQYKKFLSRKDKKEFLKKQFSHFLPEVIFRTTKIENPEVTRNQVQSYF